MDTRKAAPHTSYLLSQFQRVGLRKTEKLKAFLVGNQQIISQHSQVSASWRAAASDQCCEVSCFGLPLWTLPEHRAPPAAGAEPREAAVHGAGLQKVPQQGCVCLCSERTSHSSALPFLLSHWFSSEMLTGHGHSYTRKISNSSQEFTFPALPKVPQKYQSRSKNSALSSSAALSAALLSLEETMLWLWCRITRAGKSEMQFKKNKEQPGQKWRQKQPHFLAQLYENLIRP